MRRICRFACCRIRMDCTAEKGISNRSSVLAEKLHVHCAPALDTDLPSHSMFPATNWVLIKGRFCTLSVSHEHNSMDSAHFGAPHVPKRGFEAVGDAAGLIGNISCACDSAVAHLSGADISDAGVESSLTTDCMDKCSANAMGEAPCTRNDDVHVDASADRAVEFAESGMLGLGFENAALLVRDESVKCMNADDSTAGMMSVPNLLGECWDERLVREMIDASDVCTIHNKKMKNTCMMNAAIKDEVTVSEIIEEVAVSAANDEVAMPGMRPEPSGLGKCKDGITDNSLAETLNNVFGTVSSQITHTEGNLMKRSMQDFCDPIKALADADRAHTSSMLSSLEESLVSVQESSVSETDQFLEEERSDFSNDDWSFNSPDIPLKFSQQQMEILEAVASGKSVFITGSAGTGKSFLLMYIIRILKKAHNGKGVYVTASTGLAACALKGITLHSFAGVGMGGGTPNSLAAKVLRSKEVTRRWEEAAVLVIDEISLIDGELFDKLDFVARAVRRSPRCFGGIQLIVTGDFFQLPPVNPPNTSKFFAFQANCWNQCFDMQVELQHVFRQSDNVFITMLNEVRRGVLTPETLQKLNMCCRALPDDGTGIASTRLYPLKVDVRQENLQALRALQTTIVTFFAVDSVPNPLYRYMLKHMRTEKTVQLCVGAQVMLTKNIGTKCGLVNGAKGVVIGFQSHYDNMKDEESKALNRVSHSISPSGYWPIVRFLSGTKAIGPMKESAEDGSGEVVSRIQLPLILSWALSIHKCQGMTLNKVQTDLSKAFAFGMVYVALSRVKDLDDLQLTGFDPKRIRANPHVIHFSNQLIQKLSCKQEVKF